MESQPSGTDVQQYPLYSFSVPFAQVAVHVLTGEVRVRELVSGADAGTVINQKTAANRMKQAFSRICCQASYLCLPSSAGHPDDAPLLAGHYTPASLKFALNNFFATP